MQVQSLGREDRLEEGVATPSSVLAWRIPWTGAWRASVHGVAKSRARLNRLHVHVFTMARINLLCVILGLVLLSAASEVSRAAQRGSEQACWSKGLSQEMQKMASLEKLQKQRQ